MNKKINNVTKDEGFDIIYEINTLDDLDQIKSIFELEIKKKYNGELIKFPRTKHLTNLGAMSRDDLMIDKNLLNKMLECELIVEEKIDGANLGITKDPKTGKIKLQNRSHFINSNSHIQFKKLDQWIQYHLEDLHSLFVIG